MTVVVHRILLPRLPKNSGELERAFVLVVTPLVSIMKDEVEER